MTLLLNHLEQVSSSARTIRELPFPPPKIFTNALLGNHEITTLIRDTEPHERALFSIDPATKSQTNPRWPDHKPTAFLEGNRPSLSFSGVPRKHSAVARALGPHMLQEIGGYGENTTRRGLKGSGGVNIEVLLKGAEKLCAIYPVQGASERIASLRNRYKQVAGSVAAYEAKVASQTTQLDRMNKNFDDGQQLEDGEEDRMGLSEPNYKTAPVSDEELLAEEQAIRDLEQKKRALEERVASMEKDLNGLLG